jgi:signal transduction histidine kinase/ligand-binding sensor domain-containing protein/CheY-like chemotaxis protein
MKIPVKALSALLLIMFGLVSSNAQKTTFEFETLTTDDGLSSNQATCIFKDSRGFMWFGTRNGLNRYNAYDFVVWKHIPGDSSTIPDNHITDIVEDEYGRVWIGTYNGIAYFDYSNNSIIQFPKPEKNESMPYPTEVRELLVKENSLWIADVNGVFKLNLDEPGPKVTYISLISGNTYSARAIATSKNSTEVWMSTFSNGIYTCPQNGTKALKIHIKELEDDFSDCLFVTCNDKLLIGTGKNGVLQYNINNKEISRDALTPLQNKTEPKVFAIEQKAPNSLWISQGHSLLLCDSNLVVEKKISSGGKDTKGFLNGIVTDIYCDPDNINWFAMDVSGINIYKENARPINNFFIGTGEDNSSYVRSATVDMAGNKWVGTFGNGLMIYDTNNFMKSKFTTLNTPLPGNIVYDVEIIDTNRYWIATAGGIIEYNPISDEWGQTYTVEDNLWHNQAQKLLWEGTSMWIATREGLNRYIPEKDTIVKMGVKDGLAYHKITDLQMDGMGNVWFATYKGLSCYDKNDGGFNSFYKSGSPRLGLSDNSVYSVCPDNNGDVWLGTANGLNKYNMETKIFNWYFEKDGLISNVINKIEMDTSGKLCLLTPSGLMICDKKLNQLAVFNSNDGLNTNLNVFEITKDNQFVLGGKKTGFYKFNPYHLPINQNPPPVYITGLESFSGRKYLVDREEPVKIKFGERNIRFTFTALDYFAPDKNQFSYILEGFNKAWVHTDHYNRNAVFQNLMPGEYRFRVIASNSNNVWNRTGDSCSIIILPPWWRTWWMIVFYSCFVFGVFLMGLYLRRKRDFLLKSIQTAREDARVNEEKARLQKINEEHKIRFFTTISHELRTPLSLISLPLETMLSDTSVKNRFFNSLNLIRKNTKRLQNLVDQLLDFRKVSLDKVDISTEPVRIIDYSISILEMFTPISDSKEIDTMVQRQANDIVCLFDTTVLDKILYNLLSNAYKNTPKSGRVVFSIYLSNPQNNRNGETIEIKITNSGKEIPEHHLAHLFDRFYMVNDETDTNYSGSGIGLSVVREYTRLLKGKIMVDSKDGLTEFTLLLPIKRLPEGEVHGQPKKSSEIVVDLLEYETNMDDDTSTPVPLTNVGNSNPITLLIVEDNAELRNVIKGLFSENYTVYETDNGKSGLEKALETVPDIIISDIMMPEMDGVQMCREIKDNRVTSHIPVVLLTAKAGEEAELSGYRSGADAYLKKPFAPRILTTLVENIIGNRDKLKRFYSDDNFKHIDEVTVNESDKVFIDKVKEVTNTSIGNPDFTVKQMADQFNMSPSQLNRKFLGILGVSPGDYLRTFRLNKASELLKNSSITISEIAYQVGFKHQSNFSRAFHAQFNIFPTEYRDKNK